MQNIIQIEPYFNSEKPKSCNDNILISLANWQKRDFRFMYLDQWMFKFDNKQVAGIWKRTELASKLYFDHLLDTHRLFAKYVNFAVNDCIVKNSTDIKQIISEENPVALLLDTYYLPWNPNLYQKYHTGHACLVCGFDENGFYINDTSNHQRPISHYYINNDLFMRMLMNSHGVYFVNQNVEHKVPDNYMEDIFANNKDMFRNIDNFINYIDNTGFDEKDLEPFEGGEGIVIRAIRNVGRGRDNFMLALQALYEKTQNKKYLDVQKIIKESNDNWIMEKAILQKAYLEKNYNKYNNHIIGMINESKKKEKEAYNILQFEVI